MCVFICCRIKGPKDTHQFFFGSAKRRSSFCGTQCRGKYGRERCSCFLLWVSEFHKVDYILIYFSWFYFRLYFFYVNAIHVFSVKWEMPGWSPQLLPVSCSISHSSSILCLLRCKSTVLKLSQCFYFLTLYWSKRKLYKLYVESSINLHKWANPFNPHSHQEKEHDQHLRVPIPPTPIHCFPTWCSPAPGFS